MIEIIVAIILQITTILGGGDPGKDNIESKDKEKTEKKVSTTDEDTAPKGGSGGWSG